MAPTAHDWLPGARCVQRAVPVSLSTCSGIWILHLSSVECIHVGLLPISCTYLHAMCNSMTEDLHNCVYTSLGAISSVLCLLCSTCSAPQLHSRLRCVHQMLHRPPRIHLRHTVPQQPLTNLNHPHCVPVNATAAHCNQSR